MDSSVDVCDLMIELLCKTCPNRPCSIDDGTGGLWSHSQLMDCIRRHVKVRTWLAWRDSDIIATFINLVENGSLEGKIPEGFKVKDHVAEIIAELPIDGMTTHVNEILWDEVLIFMETKLDG